MVAAAEALPIQTGWLRNKLFDVTFVQGVAAIALLSGLIVLWKPHLFGWVLAADVWLLGYHHVIATYTRLVFDVQSVREYRFYIFVLPFIVFGTTFAAAYYVGTWVVATVYLYWQWFHYTRQSWGISQVYRGKSGGLVTESPLFSQLCLYLVPAWGILHRSWQAPDTFLFHPVWVIPVPGLLVAAVGVTAQTMLIIWAYRRFLAWRAGRLPVAHTWYMLSHYAIFIVGYILIDDITIGWLVINVWHNAQYILFVWFFNTNRFKDGIDEKARFLSRISQPKNIAAYMAVCLGISTLFYLAAAEFTSGQIIAGLPLVIVFYQTLNFHHYIVDSRIWKVRKKSLKKTLALGS